jgi:hypothetical protein
MLTNTGFVVTDLSGSSCALAGGAGFFGAVFAFPNLAQTLVGLLVTPGFGLIDTGAQHGVIGLSDFNKLCERLAEHGLKPRPLPLFQANAMELEELPLSSKVQKFQLVSKGVPG